MNIDKRVWYVIAAVVVVILIAYRGGFIGGSGEPEVAPTEQTTQTQ